MPKSFGSRRRLSRRELRDLDVEISFMEGVVRRDPRCVEALQVLGDDYTRRGRLAEGLQVDEELSKLRPDDPMVLYNLACSYSLTRRLEEAAAALGRALDAGYRDFRWLLRDPDLAPLRKHPLFQRIRSRLKTARLQVK